MMLESINVEKGETVHEQVYMELRRCLMNGRLKPGQTISIRYLGEQLGVSATPAREAIKRLQAERAFHRIIYQAAQSELMMDIIETLWMRSGPLVRLALPGDSHMAVSMAHHTHALDALKRGDAVAVRTAIEADIGGAASDLEEFLPE